ncbi:MAG: response regulator transcription factor [Bacteroidota bacterium]
MIDIIIADSNDLSRIGLRALFKSSAKINVIAEALTVDELEEQVEMSACKLVIIDFTANGFNIQNVSRLKANHRGLKFLALTNEQTALTLINAIKSGITSYVKKDCSQGEIVDAVIETARGGKFFCGQILDAIQRNSINTEELIVEGDLSCDPIILSKREEEILRFIAEGYTNPEIADKLFLSSHTINTHRRNIMGKLGVKNTVGMVMYAVREGLVNPNKFLFSPN